VLFAAVICSSLSRVDGRAPLATATSLRSTVELNLDFKTLSIAFDQWSLLQITSIGSINGPCCSVGIYTKLTTAVAK
jgi:hypothetical protein